MGHLVWDWNGTLLDDFALVLKATNDSLAEIGGPVLTADQHRTGFRRPVIEYYASVLGRPVTPAEFAALDRSFHDRYRQGVTSCALAADALAAIDEWPTTQSLLSMWAHVELVPEIERRDLTRRMLRVDGRPGDTMGDLKAEYLDRHLTALGYQPKDCVLIGDCVDDADAAELVGAHCVLYSGGFTDHERLARTGRPVTVDLVGAVRLAARIR